MSLTIRYQNFWKFNEKTLKNKYELNLDHQTSTMQKSLYRPQFLSWCDSSLIKMYCDRVEHRKKTLAFNRPQLNLAASSANLWSKANYFTSLAPNSFYLLNKKFQVPGFKSVKPFKMFLFAIFRTFSLYC